MPPPFPFIVCVKASEPVCFKLGQDGLAFEPVRRSRQNAIIKGRQAALNEQATAVKRYIATALLRNVLKSDVTRFTTHVQTCLATNKGCCKWHEYRLLIA